MDPERCLCGSVRVVMQEVSSTDTGVEWKSKTMKDRFGSLRVTFRGGGPQSYFKTTPGHLEYHYL